jgi:hypothetical protein
MRKDRFVRNIRRFAIDLLMVALFMFMFDTDLTGLPFHEWGGLAFFAVAALHLIYNRKWIIAVTGQIFRRSGTNRRTRAVYILNLTLLTAMALVLISGILISREIFPASQKAPEIWLIIHYGASIAAVGLIVIHAWLHRSFIAAILKKTALGLKTKPLIGVAVAIALTASFTIFTLTNAVPEFANHIS